MQNLRFNIAAGETKVFVMAGRYLEIIDATGPVSIGLYDKAGSQADDAKDVLSGTFMETPFSQFEISSTTAQTVELFITETRGGTRRQPGVVSVVDGNRADVQSGKAFTLTSSYGGTAATFAAIGLWNPAGSTKNAVVTEISVSAGASTSIQLGLVSIAPANMDSATNNKLLGGATAAPVQRAYQEYASASPAGFTRIYTWLGTTQANKIFARPIIVPPGFGLVAINQTAAQQLSVNLEWTNEAM